MKISRSLLYLVLAVMVAASLLSFVRMEVLWGQWHLVNHPLHASVEALGGLAAIVMATFLLLRKQEEYGGKFFLLAVGFLAMGLLDIFHSITAPGGGFVLLRSSASLIGGLWFALVWLPWFASDRDAAWKRWMPWVVVIGSIIFGIWTLVARETLPVMAVEGKFTTTAIAFNVLAGIFFVAAAARFLVDFHRYGKLEIYLFAGMAILFGMATLMFPFSTLWDNTWWLWHVLRLIAYVVVLGFIVHAYEQTLADLLAALAERGKAEEALLKAKNELEIRVADRTTDLKNANEKLRAASLYVRSLIEASLDPLVTISSDGKITDVNTATEFVTGVSREQLVGSDFSDYFTEPEKAREGYQEVFSKGFVRDYPLTIRHNSGRTTDVLYNATVYRNGAGEVEGIFAAARDITERKRAEEEIKKLNENLEHRATELAAVNKELEAFSYSASHDLRAPLRSIDGFSQALLEDYSEKLDEQGRDFLQRVRAASQRMGQLIDDMLKLSRVTRSEINRETVDLSGLVKTIAAELQQREPERKADFTIAEGVVAEGDGRLLRLVLENLLGNAWKFTGKHPRTRIEFGVLQKNDKQVYYVRDDGAGFDMAYVDKLFGAFQRLHGTTEFSGTGIGLATVQRIIHRHGGRVLAEGVVEQGATFYFTLN